ncbi:MAG: DUF3868 domain-containing protein [Duncaniella sp.]|nr:DUF3868 domain-containing protein [Duncaniella sp.]
MKLKSIILPALLLTLTASPADAARIKDDNPLKVHDIDVQVDEKAGQLNLKIDLDMADIKLPANREMIFTPVIIAENGTDSIELDPITIAGRNRWYWHLRNSDLDAPGTYVYRAGSASHATYTEAIPFEPWMGNSLVEMRQETANCCDRPDPLPGPGRRGNIDLALIDTRRPELIAEYVFAPPVDAGPVVKEVKGSAFVTFVVNRTELNPNYMINPQELQKIYNSIQLVKDDKDATITHVHIKGFASPEGPYDNNVRLAKGRTETLRQHVRDLYHFPDTTITSSFDPEDWAGLRNYITDSLSYPIQHRRELLDIIDGPLGYDARDREMKVRFPKDYAIILKEIYPWLRHSDYAVQYAIRTFTTVEEIKAAFETDPTRLRNVDFFTLAQSYPEGSPEYAAVIEKAIEIYPNDPGTNFNMANIALMRGNLDKARDYLYHAGNTPEANFARGVIAARSGDYREALRLFEQTKAAGIEKSQHYIDNINAIRDYHPVTILVTTTKTTGGL